VCVNTLQGIKRVALAPLALPQVSTSAFEPVPPPSISMVSQPGLSTLMMQPGPPSISMVPQPGLSTLMVQPEPFASSVATAPAAGAGQPGPSQEVSGGIYY